MNEIDFQNGFILGMSTGGSSIAEVDLPFTEDENGNVIFEKDIYYKNTKKVSDLESKINTISRESNAHIKNGNLHIRSGEGECSEIFNDSSNIASGDYSHAEGRSRYYDNGHYFETVVASGVASHAEGLGGNALGMGSHAEGGETIAAGMCSHTEGDATAAYGQASHAEGLGSGYYEILDFLKNIEPLSKDEIISRWKDNYPRQRFSLAYGLASHVEGFQGLAIGEYSHTEGQETLAIGKNSHAEGHGTIAASENQHVQGKFNIEDTENKYAHIVGRGYSTSSRYNAHTLDWDGNAWYAGKVIAKDLLIEKRVDGELVTESINVQSDFEQKDETAKDYIKNKPRIGQSHIVLTDTITQDNYVVCIENGNLVTYKAPSKIAVTTLPEKLVYEIGETFDPTGMKVTAYYDDGTNAEITNYTYTTPIVETAGKTDVIVSAYPCEAIFSIYVATLDDFEYQDNGDGTYTITAWKRTLNGEPSTEMIVPNSDSIKI